MSVFRKEYRKLTAPEQGMVDEIKRRAEDLHAMLVMMPQNREAALARTKLEECVMWAVKGVTG